MQNGNLEYSPVKQKLHEIIFEADTPAGKLFDVLLLLVILASVIVVMLESVNSIQIKYPAIFFFLEWGFTIIFTIEYFLRLYAVKKPMNYAASFFGIVDLLSIIPTYLSLVVSGTQYLVVIRALRLLRIFRVLKMGQYIKEGQVLVDALRASRLKISVFLFSVSLLVVIIGSVMYLVEGGQNPSFSSIPRSVYWAIVTLTTVGYGDITPITTIGQFLSAVVMILGYAIIAVPTGIVSSELIQSKHSPLEFNTKACQSCGREGHDEDAVFCKYCGEKMHH